MNNDWFKDIFLMSFKEGETQITEKQYNIFVNNLKDEFVDGYIAGCIGIVDNFKYKVYTWSCVTGNRYYIEKEKI